MCVRAGQERQESPGLRHLRAQGDSHSVPLPKPVLPLIHLPVGEQHTCFFTHGVVPALEGPHRRREAQKPTGLFSGQHKLRTLRCRHVCATVTHKTRPQWLFKYKGSQKLCLSSWEGDASPDRNTSGWVLMGSGQVKCHRWRFELLEGAAQRRGVHGVRG